MRHALLTAITAVSLVAALTGCAAQAESTCPTATTGGTMLVRVTNTTNVQDLELRVCDEATCATAGPSAKVTDRAGHDGQLVGVTYTSAGTWIASFRHVPAKAGFVVLQGGDNIIYGQERHLSWHRRVACAAGTTKPVQLALAS